MPQLDFLTEDVGSIWILTQILNSNTPTSFRGPATSVVGALDGSQCFPCDQPTLQAQEKVFFPNADLKHIVPCRIDHYITPAASVNPTRWSNLDPGYISSPSEEARLVFYGTPDNFNPSIPQLDFLTKDVGPIWIMDQIANINTPVVFRGPITTILGALDVILCIPCDQPILQAREKVFFPNADFNLNIIPKVAHDIDLHFGAANMFPMMLDLFNAATK
ncbi:hypothetical protein M422DRAFT_249192 [Sphaerobolus stellatus SS14]|nr:hypothetical protein M422DRAFT_249192 [Sphaerobolus stellatus SS14]